jgi:hypothetical protein
MLTPRNFLLLLLVPAAVVVWEASGPGILKSGQARPPAAQSAPPNTATSMCEVASPTESFSIPYVAGSTALTTDPDSPAWAHAASTWIAKDCTHQLDYPNLRTEVRGFWTDSDLNLLFISPYDELNLWLPADTSKDRLNLWDRDVVEFFLGDDWTDINRYREFEISPTGDWVDLAIDRNRNSYDATWNSGWQRQGRIDEKHHMWYAAARVPLRSISEKQVTAGSRWRANLYRINGLGPDSKRQFMCWQPTCVANRDPNHVPEHFGTLVFTK